MQATTYSSPNQKALRRFKKNIPALFGIIILFLALFIAIFAYIIAPDNTPDANDQVLEISSQPPGFKVNMLLVAKNQNIKRNSFFAKMWEGQENAYKMIPIVEHKFENDKIIFKRFNDQQGFNIGYDTLSTADVVFPLSVSQPDIHIEGNKAVFYDINKQQIQKSFKELNDIIIKQQLITKTYLLGTDKSGRDNLSRLILGVRVSLSVGLLAVLISLAIGVTLGAISGYMRGTIDTVIMWIINVFWSIPLLLLVFALVMALDRGFWQIFLAVGLTMWVETARMVRGQFLSLREKEYVEAAYSLGIGHFRIITKHLLPNTIGPIVVIAAADFATAIIIEAGLSFLGIGVQPPKPSWGSMLNEYYSYIGTSKAFLALLPGTAILIMVLAFNLIGNGLRDALDVKGQL